MVFKTLKLIGCLILLTTLTSCPWGAEDCFDIGRTARVNNLISISPLQTVYNQGDFITFKSTVPATNDYFGEQLNLLEKTNDFEALLLLGFDQLFTGNELTFIKGSQSSNSNWFNVLYNPDNSNYELEVKIKLNKIGNYNFFTDDSFEFKGASECIIYRLDTNVEGMNSDEKIVFTVQ